MTTQPTFTWELVREEPAGLGRHLAEVELNPTGKGIEDVQFYSGETPVGPLIHLQGEKVRKILNFESQPDREIHIAAGKDLEVRLLESTAFSDDFNARLSANEFRIASGERVRVPKREIPYLISGILEIEPGGVLKIESGAHLLFDPEAGVDCRGTLSARGDDALNEEGVVSFGPQDCQGHWRGILLNGPSARASTLHYSKLHAGTGFSLKDSNGEARRTGTAETRGGALCVINMGTEERNMVQISQSTFFENRADLGGAIALWNASVRLSDVRFDRNQAKMGGGLHALRSHVVLKENTFNGNTADLGGAMMLHGSTLLSEGKAEDSTFVGNLGQKGGKDIFSLNSKQAGPFSAELLAHRWPLR